MEYGIADTFVNDFEQNGLKQSETTTSTKNQKYMLKTYIYLELNELLVTIAMRIWLFWCFFFLLHLVFCVSYSKVEIKFFLFHVSLQIAMVEIKRTKE